MSDRKCILVCGMHRSGTSAVAGSLFHMGIYAGKNLMKAQHDNPKGFFENQVVHDFNRTLIKKLGYTWDDLRLSDLLDDEIVYAQSDYASAAEITKNEFLDSNLFFIKDPLLSLLLPFWIKVLRKLNISISIIKVLRDKTSIADSLKRRNNMSLRKASLLTEIYHYSIDKNSESYPRCVVSYEALMSNSQQVLDAIFEQLNVEVSLDSSKVESVIAFLEKKKVVPHLSSIQLGFSSAEDRKSAVLKLLNAINGYKEEDVKSVKVVYDFGHGFSDEYAIFLEFNKGKLNKEWSVNTGEILKRIKFVLLGGIDRVSIDSFTCYYNDRSVEYDMHSTAYSDQDGVYTFNDDHPAITFTLHQDMNRVGVNMSLVRSDKVKEKRKTTRQIVVEGLLFGMRHPIKLLKHANKDNLRVLKNAVKREDPRFILKNFKNLLLSEKSKQRSNRTSLSGVEYRSTTSTNIKRKKVLFVTRGLPQYDRSSGGKRSREILKILHEYADLLILNVGKENAEYTADYTQLGMNVSGYAGQQSYDWRDFEPSVIIYSHYYTYSDFPEIKAQFPEAESIIDSVDLHYLREERSLGMWDGINEELVAKNKVVEIEAYNQVDQVWLVSNSEVQYLKAELPNVITRVVSNIHHPVRPLQNEDNVKGLLFFGNFDHHPNVSSVQYIVEEVWSLIRKQSDTLELIIAGNNSSDRIRSYHGKNGITVLGYIEEEDIPKLYAKSIAILAPLVSGAGVKGKITQAIGYKTPVITNTVGNEGINLVHGVSGFISDDPIELAQAALRVYEGNVDVPSLTNEALKKVTNLTDVNTNKRNVYPFDI